MSDKKISELPVAASIDASDISVLVDNGTDYQYTFTALLRFMEANLATGAKVSFGTVLPQNTTGSNGDVFVNTSAGSFAQKISGAWTVVYTLPAASGADGALLYGAGMPGTSVGKNTDSYINTLTGIFYQKAAGAWSQVFSMATGPQGPRGTAGANGTNGADGNTILFGIADPSNTTTGLDGNFYINTTTYKLFGPKTSGLWGPGVSLIGAGVPGGGTAGQILAKAGGADFNTIWEDNSFVNLSGQPADNANMATALNAKVDKVTGFGLSSNDYTSAEKTKLASLTKHYQGKYSSLFALQTAIPTGSDGDYAIVVSSPNDQEYIWDSDHTAWVVTENIPASTFAALGGSPSDNASLNSVLNAKENIANKDVLNGYAGLNSSGNFNKTTDNLNEGTSNLYFTVARVLAAILTGIGFSTATAVSATDTILQAIGKLQAQITALFKIPAGGTTGQVLSKIDATDGNTQWTNALLAANNLSDLGSAQAALSNLGLPAVFNVTRTVSATINQYTEIGQITEPAIDIHGNGLTTMRLKIIISADGSPTLTSLTAMEFDIAPHFWIANGSWLTVTPTLRTGLGTNAIIYTNLQAYYTNNGDGNGYLKLRLNNNTATNGVATTFNISIYVFRPANCGFIPLTGTGTDATLYPGYNVNIWQDHNLNKLSFYAANGVNLQSGLLLNGVQATAGQVPISSGGSTNPMTWATPLLASNNFSDLASVNAAQQNLGIPQVFNVVRENGNANGAYTELGTLQLSPALDPSGWHFDEVRLRIIMTSDNATGSTVPYNPAFMVFDYVGNYWFSNGSWVTLNPSEVSGLNSNYIGGETYLQALYVNAADGNGYVKLRMIMLGTHSGTQVFWNIAIHAIRPTNLTFSPLTGTGTDTTSYAAAYGNAINLNYRANTIDIFKQLNIYSNLIAFIGSTSGQTQLKAAAVAAGSITLPASLPSSSGQNVQSDTSGNWSYSNNTVSVSSNDLTGRTTNTNILSFTVGASTAYFRVGGYINIISITTDIIQLQVVYTDENNISRTGVFYSQGTTSPGLFATGNSSFSSMEIRCKNATAITVSATLTTTGGSINYDCGARVQQL